MVKTKLSYKRSGENVRVPGFSLMDTLFKELVEQFLCLVQRMNFKKLKQEEFLGRIRWSFGLYVPDIDEVRARSIKVICY